MIIFAKMIQILLLQCFHQCNHSINWLPYIGLFSAIIATIIALCQFRQNLKIKRAETLSNLFEKFYENNTFKEVREWLDRGKNINEPIKEEDFQTKIKDESFESKFSDYLNYFQFIASLKNMGQLKEIEISSMFNYYLMNLKKHSFVMKYVKEYGYYALHEYLNQYQNAE